MEQTTAAEFEQLSERLQADHDAAMERLDSIEQHLNELKRKLEVMQQPGPPGWARLVEWRNGSGPGVDNA